MVKRMKRMDADASVRKVCFIMPNMVGGGAERVVSVLVGQFADMGIDTTLYLVKQNLVEYPINPQVKLDVSRCGRKRIRMQSLFLFCRIRMYTLRQRVCF